MTLNKIYFALVVLTLRLDAATAQTKEDTVSSFRQQIWPGAKLAADYKFKFDIPFQELIITAPDKKKLDGILFKAKDTKGLIFYLHGNNGGLNKWGKIAETYTALHYDLFILDYPGYGKSEGSIMTEDQLYSDVGAAYDTLKARYSEDHIVIMGYSMGTGPAAMLASKNHPKMLILDAPYYSLPDAIAHLVPKLDLHLLPFQFNTYQFLQKTAAPVVIFHGDKDETFYYGSSEKLKQFFKPADRLVTLPGAGHNDLEKDKEYVAGLAQVLP